MQLQMSPTQLIVFNFIDVNNFRFGFCFCSINASYCTNRNAFSNHRPVVSCTYLGFLPTISSVQMASALALLALPYRAGGAQRGPTQ